MLEDKLLELVKVHTDDNPAYLMTKGLPPERFAHCRTLMGVGYISVLYSRFCIYILYSCLMLKGTLSFKWEAVGAIKPNVPVQLLGVPNP